MAGNEKALAMLRSLPRVNLTNMIRCPSLAPRYGKRRGDHGGKTHGFGHKGCKARQMTPRIGYESGKVPFYLRVPQEPYYKGEHVRRQYPPISLHQLQLMVDTNRLDTMKPIDITTLCNTKIFHVFPKERHFGFQLTDEGVDDFSAKVNIEVQHASELVISAVERCGGVITTAYYDIDSLLAAVNPFKFFMEGNPIPRRKLPPQDAVGYYTSAANRGYLAHPDEVAKERLVLAQKYGYQLPDLQSDPDRDMLLMRKDPLQVFDGLHPGWVVNLRDKQIYRLRQREEELHKYYNQ